VPSAAARRRATQSRARAAPRTAARPSPAARSAVVRRPAAAARTEARRPAVVRSLELSAAARRRAVASVPAVVLARLPSVRFLPAERSLAAHRVAETAGRQGSLLQVEAVAVRVAA